MLFDEIFVAPFFFLLEQVHTHPMITATRTTRNAPISDPRAIVGASCALDFTVVSELISGLDTPTRLGCVSLVTVFSGPLCIQDG